MGLCVNNDNDLFFLSCFMVVLSLLFVVLLSLLWLRPFNWRIRCFYSYRSLNSFILILLALAKYLGFDMLIYY